MKKNINNVIPGISIKGFTLIELLVAAALSMIVLIAAGSGFFTTQRLSSTAGARLQVQQDLRNASNMIVRDSRMAGTFGCFNMAKQAISGNVDVHDYETINGLSSFQYKDQYQGIKFIDRNDAVRDLSNNFVINSDQVLVFTYGIGSANGYRTAGTRGFAVNMGNNDELRELVGHDSAPIVVSSCSVIERFIGANKVDNANVLEIRGVSSPLADEHNSASSDFQKETTVFRQAVNIYAIGTPAGGEKGLYMFQLNPDGKFGDPQLLLAGVDNWNVQFGYSSGCSSLQNDAKISFENSIRTGANAVSPTLLKIKLIGTSGGDLIAGKASNSSESNIQTYNIDATIRGGNLCAERSFDQAI